MSIIFTDGFATGPDCSKKWDFQNGSGDFSDYVIKTTSPRYTGGSYLETYANNASYIGLIMPVNPIDEIIVGFGYRRTVREEGLLFGINRLATRYFYFCLKMEHDGSASIRFSNTRQLLPLRAKIF